MYIGKRCAVVGCRNCDGDIKVWKESVCKLHPPLLHEDCPCLKPFSMHSFPQGERNKSIRQCWIQNLQRKNFDPGTTFRVCSIHFVDGRPTEDNPYPTLHLGTPYVRHKGRRKIKKHVTVPAKPDVSASQPSSSSTVNNPQKPDDDQSEVSSMFRNIRTYQRPRRTNDQVLANCPTCGCERHVIKKVDKCIQVQLQPNQYQPYIAGPEQYLNLQLTVDNASQIVVKTEPLTEN
ncbi:hypothetical protein HPB49_013813 [Dermacentor silvarum]|uniref:Uncharacterized protein n=1 Tax=Dermacentor silvarum TaxID=543639 RepID=A0ACB8CXE2_DERSI|nr:uncharacterized protein LOC119450683 [Dermacentor silvarum]KAH7953898.1 hypothetical protein HPB49_013813 [Dermacentor silvarum]